MVTAFVWIRVFSNYDTPMFLAFMTIVPSMAFFLVQMETSFVKHYAAYYQGVRGRADYFTLEEKKEGILKNLTDHFKKFVFFQGILSGFVILFIHAVAEAVHLNPLQTGIFRIGILGTFLQMGFLMILNILFYFDFQKEACAMTLLFAAANTFLTAVTLKIGLPAYGFGFASACFVTVAAGFFVMDAKIRDLSYWTFMRQPILLPKLMFEKEQEK